MPSGVLLQDWGLIPYARALEQQQQLQADVQNGKSPPTIVLCSHSPVVTLGRASKPSDLMGWSGETVAVNRGGRATYHGPNQIIIYPILNLKGTLLPFASMDLHAYMRFLELLVVEFLESLGIVANDSVQEQEAHREQADGNANDEQHRDRAPSEGSLSYTGVWVKGRKIASIGISVSKWVSMHGVAINVSYDPQAFSGINPCGFKKEMMTSVEEQMNQPVDGVDLKSRLIQKLNALFFINRDGKLPTPGGLNNIYN